MVESVFHPSEAALQRVHVRFEYPVLFTADVLDPSDPRLAWAISRLEPERQHPAVVCLDSGLVAADPELPDRVSGYFAAHTARLLLKRAPLLVSGGEAAKNDPSEIATLLDTFAAAKLDRQACVVVIGGGAVLDAVGYAAALVHRGVRLVRLPSTVLAQADGGVGVKNGVNAFGAKNFLGTFVPPFAVINSASFLRTLPERDVRAGLAESVKVACIRDPELFGWLERHAEDVVVPGAALDHAVRRSAELHLQHIQTAGDPFEQGSARPLDFGHWAAHKLEVLSSHALRHGEAVSIGMQLDARYAQQTGLLPASELMRLVQLLRRLGLPHAHPAMNSTSEGQLSVLRGIEEFREHLGGQLCVTLLRRIGQSIEVHDLDERRVEAALRWLQGGAVLEQ